MCPWCNELPVKDFNAFPQRMWETDQQVWSCEWCGLRIFRTFIHSRWTEWRKSN